MNRQQGSWYVTIALIGLALLGVSPTQAEPSRSEVPTSDSIRAQLHGQVRALIEGEDFAGLDRVAEELRAHKHPLSKYPWIRSSFNAALFDASPDLSLSNPAAYFEFLDRWDATRPGSVPASLARANALIHWGWKARGNGLANTVSSAGFDLFLDRITKADQILETLRKSGVQDGQIYVLSIQAAKALSRPDRERRAYFNAGFGIDRNDWQLFESYADSISRKWGGAPGALEAFADELYAKHGSEGAAVYAKIAAWQTPSCKLGTFTLENSFSWQKIKKGYDGWLADGHPTVSDIHQYARLAVEFEDRETAARIFAQTGDTWSGDARNQWHTVAVFKRWRTWAGGAAEGESSGQRPIHRAAAKGDIKAIEELIRSGADINELDGSRKTALFYALEQRHYPAVAWLVGHKINVNQRNRHGGTVLHLASAQGSPGLLDWLIKHDADDSIMNHDGQVPLHITAQHGFVPATQFLLSRPKVDPNVRDVWGRTPLYLACQKGHYGVAKLLLNRSDVDIDSRDQWHFTALHAAAGFGDLKLVQLLVDKGAAVDAPDMHRRTPLVFAERQGQSEVVQYLQHTAAR